MKAQNSSANILAQFSDIWSASKKVSYRDGFQGYMPVQPEKECLEILFGWAMFDGSQITDVETNYNCESPSLKAFTEDDNNA